MKKNTRIKESKSRILFRIINGFMLFLVCAIVIVPIWNVLITSLAEDKDVLGGTYLLWPKSLTLKNYITVLKSNYMQGLKNSLFVAFVGTAFSMVLTVPFGYALAQKRLIGRKIILKMVSFTMVFHSGIIPSYILIKNLGLIDTYASLILPFGLTTYNLILVRNFMGSISDSLVESAKLDGCNDYTALIHIILPLSMPILAAVTLFYFVGYWNRYTDVVLYINSGSKYTLQVLLRSLMFDGDTALAEAGRTVYDNTKRAVMVLGMLPVMIIYPFVQKHFVSGLMVGAVKE